MSEGIGIDVPEEGVFKIKWWDLSKSAQQRLLNCIFGTEPIAITKFESTLAKDEEKENESTVPIKVGDDVIYARKGVLKNAAEAWQAAEHNRITLKEDK